MDRSQEIQPQNVSSGAIEADHVGATQKQRGSRARMCAADSAGHPVTHIGDLVGHGPLARIGQASGPVAALARALRNPYFYPTPDCGVQSDEIRLRRTIKSGATTMYGFVVGDKPSPYLLPQSIRPMFLYRRGNTKVIIPFGLAVHHSRAFVGPNNRISLNDVTKQLPDWALRPPISSVAMFRKPYSGFQNLNTLATLTHAHVRVNTSPVYHGGRSAISVESRYSGDTSGLAPSPRTLAEAAGNDNRTLPIQLLKDTLSAARATASRLPALTDRGDSSPFINRYPNPFRTHRSGVKFTPLLERFDVGIIERSGGLTRQFAELQHLTTGKEQTPGRASANAQNTNPRHSAFSPPIGGIPPNPQFHSYAGRANSEEATGPAKPRDLSQFARGLYDSDPVVPVPNRFAIPSDADILDSEQRAVRAIGRHGFELLRSIEHEVRKRKRSAF
jgi:hypothetical protein